MRARIVVDVTRADRRRLEAIIADRSEPQKHEWRANIILATADGCGATEIMPRSGKLKPEVGRWYARFMAEGVEGLTRDKTRKSGKQPLPTSTLKDVDGLYVDSPAHAVVHSVDKKSQIQALDLDRLTRRQAVLWRPRLPRTTSEALHPDCAATLRSASSLLTEVASAAPLKTLCSLVVNERNHISYADRRSSS